MVGSDVVDCFCGAFLLLVDRFGGAFLLLKMEASGGPFAVGFGKSRQSHVAFSVNDLGEKKARQLAIRAREDALAELEGVFWASARGA